MFGVSLLYYKPNMFIKSTKKMVWGRQRVHGQKNSTMTLQHQQYKYTLAHHHSKTHKPAVYLSCSDVKGLINSFNLELNVLTRSAGWPLLHINPVHQGTRQTPKIYTHTRSTPHLGGLRVNILPLSQTPATSRLTRFLRI